MEIRGLPRGEEEEVAVLAFLREEDDDDGASEGRGMDLRLGAEVDATAAFAGGATTEEDADGVGLVDDAAPDLAPLLLLFWLGLRSSF